MHRKVQYANEYAETEFERYRIIQDRLFRSDFEKMQLESPGFEITQPESTNSPLESSVALPGLPLENPTDES